jgi:hypothetical protein
MSPSPIVPLRWYELWMLRFLSRSPRIQRITIYQASLEPVAPAQPDFVNQLEALYEAPPAQR